MTIVFHDAGGGHRSAAEAVQAILVARDLPWEVTLLNLQHLLDSLDVVRKFTGLRIQDVYNQILRKGWTTLTAQLLIALQGIIRFRHPAIVEALRAYWAKHPADLVLSVIPHFNRALAESVRNADRAVPFITLITDLADYPPHFWIERQSQFIIVGTKQAKQQALAMGHPPDHIFQTSGMVLKPRFYETVRVDRVAERKRLGLHPECPTGLILFGGHGSSAMVDIAKAIDESDSNVQLILLCGHNQKLAAKLKRVRTKRPILVQGFTGEVEYFMRLADFFIGKPGPGSISEALQLHLPVIVECNRKTLPQERYNAEWIAEQGFGIVVPSFRKIGVCIRTMLENGTLNELRRNASSYSNRALLEIPGILEQCWEARNNDSERRMLVTIPMFASTGPSEG